MNCVVDLAVYCRRPLPCHRGPQNKKKVTFLLQSEVALNGQRDATTETRTAYGDSTWHAGNSTKGTSPGLGCTSVGRTSDRHAADAGSILRCGRGIFLRINFQCRPSYGVRTPLCAVACVYTCAHVKDPVVHVRVRRMVETLKHPASTLGWVARLCRSWLSSWKATRISHGRSPVGTIHL